MNTIYDPGILPDIPVVREEKTFTDKGGTPFVLAMEVDQGGDSWWAIDEKARELAEYWSEPSRMVRYRVSQSMCKTIAALMLYQAMPTEANDASWTPWPFEYWANLMRRDHSTYLDVVLWVRSLEGRARGEEMGNDSAAAEEQPSLPRY